jgi:hypothetical protein
MSMETAVFLGMGVFLVYAVAALLFALRSAKSHSPLHPDHHLHPH